MVIFSFILLFAATLQSSGAEEAPGVRAELWASVAQAQDFGRLSPETLSGWRGAAVHLEERRLRRPVRIVIDPGHGGFFPGAQGKKRAGQERTLEKDVNLRYALTLYALLKEDARFAPYLTRSGDETVLLVERVEFAVQKQADMFISLHANGRYPEAHPQVNGGVEIYVLSAQMKNLELCDNEREKRALRKILPDIPDRGIPLPGAELRLLNVQAVERLQGVFAERLRPLVGEIRVLRRDHFVLRCAPMPSVLVEMGFLTNPMEEGRLLEDRFRTSFTYLLYRSLVRYFFEPSSP
ncbi:MAG: N-acetylmuramoyl-L-alanine amidase [Elusimicrobia bacterium]|nr:N-acetylmuramoyl-L-alanine amidase [Elusimicrobiota bacterium]